MKRVIYSPFSSSAQGSTSPVLTKQETIDLKAAVDAILNDDVLTGTEKAQTFLPTVTELNQLSARLITKANSLSISSTALSNAKTAFTNYLNGLSPSYTNITVDTPISRTTVNTLLSTYTDEIAALQTNIQGQPGADGQTTYTWIAYANDATGSTGFTTGAWTNQTYIGIATNKTTATESNTPGDYVWSKIQGPQGLQGSAGVNTAIVYLYQRATSAPAKPTGALTYTFATNTLSGTMTSGWSTTIPAGTNPLYVIAATASSQTSTDDIAPTEWSAPVVLAQNGSNGGTGSAGINAATVYLYARGVTAPALPTISTTYTFSTNGLSPLPSGWQRTIPAGTDPIWVTLATAAANTATDTIASTEWATATILAQNGTNGTNAIVGFLTNETSVVGAANDGSGYSLTLTGGTFKMFNGVTDVTTASTYRIGGGTDNGTTWTRTKNGLTLTVNETTGVYSFSGASWITDSEAFDLYGLHSGVEVYKVVQVTKSKVGAAGDPGSNAKLITVSATHQTFPYDTNGVPKPQTMTVTATKQNADALTVKWYIYGLDNTLLYSNRTTAQLGEYTYHFTAGTGDSFSMTETQFKSLVDLVSVTDNGIIVEARLSDGSVSDKISIIKVQDGAVGPAGANAIVGFLTNESHVLPCDKDGNVLAGGYSGATGSFRVFSGSVDVSDKFTLSTISNPQGIGGTFTAPSAGVAPTYTLTSVPNSPAYDVHTWTIRATGAAPYAGVTVDKTFTVTKSKTGATGSAGSNAVTLQVMADRQTIVYDGNGSLSPELQTITFTTTKQNTAASVGWTMTDLSGGYLNPATYLTSTVGNTVSMTAANFDLARGSTPGVIVKATLDGSSGTIYDQISIVKVQQGSSTDRNYSFNYQSLAQIKEDWEVSGGGEISYVTTDDLGGYAIDIGNNSGNDRVDFYANEWIDFDPLATYEVTWDVQIFDADGANLLYAGVNARNKDGIDLGNSNNYVNFSALSTSTYAAADTRLVVRAYIKGYTSAAGSGPGSTVSSPVGLPNGVGNGGANPTVKFRPMLLANYPSAAGRIRVHGCTIRNFGQVTGDALAKLVGVETNADVTKAATGPSVVELNYSSTGTLTSTLPKGVPNFFLTPTGGTAYTSGVTWTVTTTAGSWVGTAPTMSGSGTGTLNINSGLTGNDATLRVTATYLGKTYPPITVKVSRNVAAPDYSGGTSSGGTTGVVSVSQSLSSTSYVNLTGSSGISCTVGSGGTVSLSCALTLQSYEVSGRQVTVQFQRETSPGTWADVGTSMQDFAPPTSAGDSGSLFHSVSVSSLTGTQKFRLMGKLNIAATNFGVDVSGSASATGS